MALSASGIKKNAIRHCDPRSLVHEHHVRDASSRRVIDRVVVDVTRDDAAKLNALGDQWEKHWEGWKGDTYLIETTTFQLTTGNKLRTKLTECEGQTFTGAANKINRIQWYWSLRTDKGVSRKAKRKVEAARLGRICDRHTVSFSPPQMRLLQKLGLGASEAKRLLTTLQEKSVQFVAEETGRHLVGTAQHADSGILHFDIVSSRIDPENNLSGEKSLPSLSNEAWTIGAWRQKRLGCSLSDTKTKWLQQNLDRFSERHGDRQPILLQLHEKLDQDFEEWVGSHGHSQLWEESKIEYRNWVAETDPRKEQFAEERASGKAATRLAERIAVHALRVALPPPLFTFVMNAMTVAQILSDLLELDRNASASGLLLQLTVASGRAILKSLKKSSKIRKPSAHRDGRYL
jgi:hypothetical protein